MNLNKSKKYFNNKFYNCVLRSYFLILIILSGILLLILRIIFLQFFSGEFLRQQGEYRYEKIINLKTNRGNILDRNGVILSTSLQTKSVFVIPKYFKETKINELSNILKISKTDILKNIRKNKNFIYLKRKIKKNDFSKLKNINISGIYYINEDKRYYPTKDLTSHLIGFTNIDDKGQEGIELSFNKYLLSKIGLKKIIKDCIGNNIKEKTNLRHQLYGKNLHISIDIRLQYLVYRYLKKAVNEYNAKSGSIIIADIKNGELLSMVNFPSYNQNEKIIFNENIRNKSITDVVEPGSIIKPFIIALGLELNKINEESVFNILSDSIKYGKYIIKDVRNNSSMNISNILKFSSNIGMIMISDKIRKSSIWNCFNILGFGSFPKTNFPGTRSGYLKNFNNWHLIEKATISYGYGLSLSLFQITQAYTVFARNGDIVPINLIKENNINILKRQIFSPKVSLLIRSILEKSINYNTSKNSKLNNYYVAGKSGTARKLIQGKYSKSKYLSSFIGFAGINKPKIIISIFISEPKKKSYYGNTVAAPVFSKILNKIISNKYLKTN